MIAAFLCMWATSFLIQWVNDWDKDVEVNTGTYLFALLLISPFRPLLAAYAFIVSTWESV